MRGRLLPTAQRGPTGRRALRPVRSRVIHASMPALDPVDIAVHLMEADSTSGREEPAIARAEALLSGRGWRCARIPVGPGRDNLLATSGDLPKVTLSTHLDTVPPYLPPRRAGGTLYGRGACDAKGIAASMICAAEGLRATGVSVALLFVVGEETAHDGARAANAYQTSSTILINGEPTESTLALGTKGAIRATVRVHGRAAHSAYPAHGRSATRELVQLLAELETLKLPQDDVLGATTINIGFLSGGVADNVLAPVAEARLMARLVTPAAELQDILRAWAHGRAELEFGVMVPPVRLTVLPGFATSVVAFATDIPALTAWGKPYLFGPGSILQAHTDDECVAEADLVSAVDAYQLLAHEALARL